MTLENWLMIAVIISTLIAPTIAELVKPRINQLTPAPEANQPKNLIQRIGGRLIRLAASPSILPPLGILYDIGVLVWVIRGTAPVTRAVVFVIASAMVGVAWNLLNMNVLLLMKNQSWQTDTVAKQTEIMAKQCENIELIIERLEKTERRIDTLDATLKPCEKVSDHAESSKSTRALGKLLAAVKNLFGP